LLQAVARERKAGVSVAAIARAFHNSVAHSVAELAAQLCERCDADAVVCSGGVFQNALLLSAIVNRLDEKSIEIWTNHLVPPNDGGISLGQAAIAAVAARR
jgi:hydrogenase maturation protein HypF